MLFQKISFFKIPNHQRFNYEPRFYDPIREELQERESRIKSELNKEEEEFRRQNIKGAFKSNLTFESSTRYESKTNKNTGLLRIIIIVILTGGLWSYWEFGSDSIYFLLILLPVYYFLRRSKII